MLFKRYPITIKWRLERKLVTGIDTQRAIRTLVENVSRVERYGIEIHCAKSIINPTSVLDTFERPDTLVEIGVSSEGICVFKNGIKDEQDLAWKHIDKIRCESKQFILIIQADTSPDEYFKVNFTFSSSKNNFIICQPKILGASFLHIQSILLNLYLFDLLASLTNLLESMYWVIFLLPYQDNLPNTIVPNTAIPNHFQKDYLANYRNGPWDLI